MVAAKRTMGMEMRMWVEMIRFFIFSCSAVFLTSHCPSHSGWFWACLSTSWSSLRDLWFLKIKRGTNVSAILPDVRAISRAEELWDDAGLCECSLERDRRVFLTLNTANRMGRKLGSPCLDEVE